MNKSDEIHVSGGHGGLVEGDNEVSLDSAPTLEQLSKGQYGNTDDLGRPITGGKKPKKDHFWLRVFSFMLLVLVLRFFVIDPFLVHGSSMEPTFNDGDYVIVDKLSYKLRQPVRGEVIVFDAPTDDGRYFIKRIIGLPGERVIVDGSSIKVINKEYPQGFALKETYIKFQSDRKSDKTLGPTEYFVMGDNREVSSDSRIWGALEKEAIEGRAMIRILPFKEAGIQPGSVDKFEGVAYP